MKLLVIYNPNAGGGNAAKVLSPIQKALEERNIEATFLLTQHHGHAIELTANADLENYDGIIATGGDGTLSEVVNGYYQNPTKGKPPIGLIPNGTGNAFMKELKLKPGDWHSAIDIIVQGHLKAIDVARYEQQNEIRYFINIIGTGFVADAAKAAVFWKFLGTAAYNIAVFHQLINLKSRPMTFILDGKTIKRDCTLVEVANSCYTGTDMIMAPKAKLDDGKLDVILLNKLSRLRLIKIFKTIFSGKHIYEPEVETWQASSIKIDTSEALTLVPDGEILGETPVEITCLKQDIKLFWPEE